MIFAIFYLFIYLFWVRTKGISTQSHPAMSFISTVPSSVALVAFLLSVLYRLQYRDKLKQRNRLCSRVQA